MEGTIGEIRWFAGNFAPKNWAYCQAQVINIASNTALFSILGTTYGGNGTTTFALPDFRGRVAIGQGTGPGLTNRSLGESAGVISITLGITNLPVHTHPIAGSVTPQVNNDTAGLTDDASGKRLGASGNIFTAASGDLVNMAPLASTLSTAPAGGNQPFGIMPPYIGMNFIICQYGVFPSRN